MAIPRAHLITQGIDAFKYCGKFRRCASDHRAHPEPVRTLSKLPDLEYLAIDYDLIMNDAQAEAAVANVSRVAKVQDAQSGPFCQCKEVVCRSRHSLHH